MAPSSLTSSLSTQLLETLENIVSNNELVGDSELSAIQSRLKASTRHLSTLQNRNRPINRLPASSLALSFRFLQAHLHQEYTLPKKSHSPSSSPNAWLSVTHVCTHWRAIAHTTQDIWTTIYVLPTSHGPVHVPFFLEHSADLPLKVYFYGIADTAPQIDANNDPIEDYYSTLRRYADYSEIFPALRRAMRLLGSHSGRFEELVISSTFPRHLIHRVTVANTLSGAIADAFQLRNSAHSGTQTPDTKTDIAPPISGFMSLFNKSAPLRKLVLPLDVAKPLLLSSIRFDALKRLRFYSYSYASSGTLGEVLSTTTESELISLGHLLDFISGCSTTLRALSLVRISPVIMDSESKSEIKTGATDLMSSPALPQVISLPSLSCLELGAWPRAADVPSFLARLRIPGSTKRVIWGEKGKVGYLSSTLLTLDVERRQRLQLEDHSEDKRRSQVDRGVEMNIRRVVISCAGPVTNQADGGALHKIEDMDMLGVVDGTLYIKGSYDVDDLYPLLRDHPQVFEKVTELVLIPNRTGAVEYQVHGSNPPRYGRMEVGWSHEEYRHLFNSMRNIVKLDMRDADLLMATRAMGLFDGDNDSGSFLLRNLAELSISYPCVDDPKEKTSPYPAAGESSPGSECVISTTTLLLTLTSLVQRRSQSGHPLSVIKLRTKGRKDGQEADGASRNDGRIDSEWSESRRKVNRVKAKSADCGVVKFEWDFDMNTGGYWKGKTRKQLTDEVFGGVWPTSAAMGNV